MGKWSIVSERKSHPGGAHHIIYEWEDVIANKLSMPIVNVSGWGIYLLIDKVLNRIHLNLFGWLRIKKVLSFQLSASIRSSWRNSKNVIPWIIDFYIPKQEYEEFFLATKNNKIVFISSLEVYDSLSSHRMFDAQKYIHLPLSVPDKYKINVDYKFDKKYDLVMLGRSDSLLNKFVERYACEHSNFNYITRIADNTSFTYYINNHKGKSELLKSKSHDAYLDIMKQAKVGIWSTRGLDDPKCNGYNQVTPRLFELITSGCHVLARYPKNADTAFFEIDKFCPNIENYRQFCTELEKRLTVGVDMDFYARYMDKHYTSQRVAAIKSILY